MLSRAYSIWRGVGGPVVLFLAGLLVSLAGCGKDDELPKAQEELEKTRQQYFHQDY